METTDIESAIAFQQELRQRVINNGDISGVDLIGGADTSSLPTMYSGRWKMENGSSETDMIHAAIVVWSISQKRIVANSTISMPLTFPYIPGLLALREAPSLLAAWERLPSKPEVIICDGHGIAHPRRCGIACHLGVALGIPSIGCGKSRLTGWFEHPGTEKGSWSDLFDKDPNKSKIQNPNSKIGRVVRTRTGVAPVFVSVGHMCDIEGATGTILGTSLRYRLPEPIRAAHIAGKTALLKSISTPEQRL